jgi:hypothetical protein
MACLHIADTAAAAMEGLILFSIAVGFVWLAVVRYRQNRFHLLSLEIGAAVFVAYMLWNLYVVACEEYADATTNLQGYRFLFERCQNADFMASMTGSKHSHICSDAIRHRHKTPLQMTMMRLRGRGFSNIFFNWSVGEVFSTIADRHFGHQFLFITLVITVAATAILCGVFASSIRRFVGTASPPVAAAISKSPPPPPPLPTAVAALVVSERPVSAVSSYKLPLPGTLRNRKKAY